MVDKELKEQIIAEYLTSGLTYRQIADKRGVDYRSLDRPELEKMLGQPVPVTRWWFGNWTGWGVPSGI